MGIRDATSDTDYLLMKKKKSPKNGGLLLLETDCAISKVCFHIAGFEVYGIGVSFRFL